MQSFPQTKTTRNNGNGDCSDIMEKVEQIQEQVRKLETNNRKEEERGDCIPWGAYGAFGLRRIFPSPRKERIRSQMQKTPSSQFSSGKRVARGNPVFIFS